MLKLLENGYKAKLRPSGHDISENFAKDNKGAIPPNLLEMANTDSNSSYLRACREHKLKPHPARFPHGLPEFFIKFLTDPGDLVVDPFAGSNITGEVAERFQRRWLAFELVEVYLEGSKFRFPEVYRQGYMFNQPAINSTEQIAPEMEQSQEVSAEQPHLLESPVEYEAEEDDEDVSGSR
jgi:DNA modification methylase